MAQFDVFLADCPARTTLGVIGNTWVVVVLVALGEKPLRYTALQARIGGISKKMLTQTLRRLEDAVWSPGARIATTTSPSWGALSSTPSQRWSAGPRTTLCRCSTHR